MSARYQFLPWVRQGVATAIRTVDTLGTGVSGRAVLPLALRVNRRVDAGVSLRLYGPGDVTGFDTRVVVRTDPPHMAADFEPNYFPSIELDLPDLPWLLTPAIGDVQARLRPWLCLVAVRKQPGVTLTTDRQRPLPVLAIRGPAVPADELPDLSESWAWAHGQVVNTGTTAPRDLLARGEGQPVSRLICPRRLRPREGYYACLVPAFDAGRRAGLGQILQPEDEGELSPAWNMDAMPSEIELPVYFHWEFHTGAAGDFESLVRRLRGQQVPEGVGSRPLDVNDPGFGLPGAGVLPQEGALRVPVEREEAPLPAAFVDALRNLTNQPDALRDQVGDDPIVAPPIYGSWHSATRSIDVSTAAWVREANLDPRHRAAAGLGTLVVQDQQENLMASAWEQLGEAGHQQRNTRQRELGRTVLSRVHGELAQLSPERFLQVTTPLHSRVRLERAGVLAGAPPEPNLRTARENIRLSRLPVAVASASFRRVTRPRGPLLRRTTGAGTGGTPARPTLIFSARFDAPPSPRLAAAALTSADAVTPAAIEDRIRSLIVLSTMLGVASQFNAAVREVGSYLAAATGTGAPSGRPGLVVGEFKLAMLEQIDPARAARAVTRAAAPAPVGEPGESLPGPSFPQPMYEALRELAPDLLLPGVELIPPDSITLLQTNPPVIAAFMLGLNHEMSRELLWREYPSDLRATCFRRFWAGPAEMPDLHRWPADSALGAQVADGSGDEHLVLLVRGELLQRYPRTMIYAIAAVDRRTPGTERRYPIFRASLGPDLTCFGFDLSADEVRGGASAAGWFFVIEQPAGQARFGFDESVATGRDLSQLASWNDLAWGDMAATPDLLARLSHAPIAGSLLRRRIGSLEWGLNAGHMAGITLQRPVRVLQHAADLLPVPPRSPDA